MPTRPIRHGERVEIYWNLNRNCYSVRSGGRVIGYTDKFTLTDATFSSQKAGRNRVRRTGRKNVHAFIRGTWSDFTLPASLTRVTYNPYTDESFVIADNARTPIHTAPSVIGGYRYKDGTPVANIHIGW